MLMALTVTWAVWSGVSRAVLTIEITEGVVSAIPIAVVPFGSQGPGAPPENISEVITADLKRSGYFSPLPSNAMPEHPTQVSEVNLDLWRGRGNDNLVVGSVRPVEAGRYLVQFQLVDILGGKVLVGERYQVGGEGSLRRLAHQIADIIYEKLTGQRGAFSTRIAYVTVNRDAGNKFPYVLNVADSDGYNPQPIVRSPEPILSPAWSPDGRKLAYVSLESRRAQVYVQDVATGTRERVSASPGLNSAPAWSPDGRYLAMTLSKDGNPEIYLLSLATGALQRITNNPAIDTEAAWAPDGQAIVFTSDRGGSPQLYRVAPGGGPAERLTFEGSYNARASFSLSGRALALVHRTAGRFRIAALDLETGALRVLSDGALDESPSVAPNGSLVIYATRSGGRGILAAVSMDGQVHQRLVATEGEVREPAWSPFTHN
jgi:TolB protein